MSPEVKAESYAYINTRVRAMRSKLIEPAMYPKLLKMSIAEITRYLEDNEYKKEIDEMSPRYEGINLIEYALTRNMARHYKRILDFSFRRSKEIIRAYLRKWDIWNIKVIMRGKYAHASQWEIFESIVPAGELTEEFLKRVIDTTSTVQEAIGALKGTSYYPVLSASQEEVEKRKETGPLEDALDQFYYSEMSKIGEGKLAQFIAIETDALNVMMLLRLKAIDAPDGSYSFLPYGRHFKMDELKRLSQRGYNDVLAELSKSRLAYAFEDTSSLSRISLELKKRKMRFGRRLLYEYKMNIDPVMGYFAAKKVEVDNLRIILRGKHSGLPEELIKRQLVL